MNINPFVGLLMQSNEVEILLQEGALVLTPLDQAGVCTTAPRSWYTEEQTHLESEVLQLNCWQTSFKMETAPS